jgi:hypothetical protein
MNGPVTALERDMPAQGSIAAIVAAAAIVAFPFPAFSQSTSPEGGDFHIGDCAKLRQACQHPEELSSQGMANCHQYVMMCKEPADYERCAQECLKHPEGVCDCGFKD